MQQPAGKRVQHFVTAVDELQRAADGDLQSINQICLNTWEPLYYFLYFKVQNREEAEDITQEAFVKALTYVREHRSSPGNLAGFLKAVALNIIRDRWRQEKRRGVQVNFESLSLEGIADQDQQAAITQRLQMENALAELKQDQRTVIDLRIVKGYTVAETARLTGKTAAAVRTAQHRALQNLAHILDEHDHKEG
jgi:RNA polymerase sigma-70 factor (ECF subfamily)